MNGYWLIISFVAGWLIAQFVKIVTGCFDGRITLKKIMHLATKSGGMPSGHTASFASLCTCLGLYYGFDSPLFAVAFCTMLIVIYDAVNVRFAVGEQGKAVNRIIKDAKKYGDELKVVEGHTIAQVIMGLLAGVVAGFIVASIASAIEGWALL